MRVPLTTYRTLCTEYYDLEPHPYHHQALEFYLYQAQHAHGNILEPMCGTGRFLIPLAQAGFDIEGFDASPEMLSALKHKYPQAHAWQEFVQDFKSDKLYSLIFVPYGSWGLITDLEESKKGLANMFRQLAPGGKFIVEIEPVASAPKTLSTWHSAMSTRKDGSLIKLNTYPIYNPETQIFASACRYESIVHNAIQQTETENFKQYLYRFDEFEQYLCAAGFTDIKKYQDYKKTTAVDKEAPLLIYECTK